MLEYDIAKVWLSDMLRAALFLERCRVVHLDIKLPNMLVDAASHLLFCDLGFAVALVSPSCPVPRFPQVAKMHCGTGVLSLTQQCIPPLMPLVLAA